MIKDRLINYFGKNIKELLKNVDTSYFEEAEEIRIRLNRSIIIKSYRREYVVLQAGRLSEDFFNEKIYKPSTEDIKQTIETMSDYSIYTFEQEIKNGFITLKGGFRVGLSGRIILEGDNIKTMRNISSMNIRIAREVKGSAKKLVDFIYKDGIKSTIIISPPNCGKTTLLRDIIRIISDKGENVGLIDERSEIASTYMGDIQLDVGKRTDVMDRCPKPEGMLMLLRSMAPSIIAVDEIGSFKDIQAIEKVANSGVRIICTIHAESIEELKEKKDIDYILNKKIFERFIVLNRKDKVCNIDKIYDGDLKCYEEGKL